MEWIRTRSASAGPQPVVFVLPPHTMIQRSKGLCVLLNLLLRTLTPHTLRPGPAFQTHTWRTMGLKCPMQSTTSRAVSRAAAAPAPAPLSVFTSRLQPLGCTEMPGGGRAWAVATGGARRRERGRLPLWTRPKTRYGPRHRDGCEGLSVRSSRAVAPHRPFLLAGCTDS